MKFNKGKVRTDLLTTDVENLFINDYMSNAPGDYVKVYLFGLMCSRHQTQISDKAFANSIGISQDNIDEAWKYWQDRGLVKIEGNEIQFLSIREKLYTLPENEKTKDFNENKDSTEEKTLKQAYDIAERELGRTLSKKELETIADWINLDGVTLDIIENAYTYCTEIGKLHVNYVASIVREWNNKGLKTKEQISEYLQNSEYRQTIYKQVLRALGLTKNITPSEKALIDIWLDELKFDMDKIMEACEKASFTASPNIRYVDKVLKNWHEEGQTQSIDSSQNAKMNISQFNITKFYEHLREKAELKAKENKDRVYAQVGEIENIDYNLNLLFKKLSKGILRGMTKQEMDIAKQQIKELEAQRAILLTENNFPIDYTDIKYSCLLCNDTGIDENGKKCKCVNDRLGEMALWQEENQTQQTQYLTKVQKN